LNSESDDVLFGELLGLLDSDAFWIQYHNGFKEEPGRAVILLTGSVSENLDSDFSVVQFAYFDNLKWSINSGKMIGD